MNSGPASDADEPPPPIPQRADSPQEPTDWVPLQRRMALAGLLGLALGCGVLSVTLLVWGRRAAPARTTLLPLGLTLLCLGTTLLAATYWYALRHASTLHDGHAGRAMAAMWLLWLEGLVAGLTLIVLVVSGLVSLWMSAALEPLALGGWTTQAPRWLVSAQTAWGWGWPTIRQGAGAIAAGGCLLCSFLLGASLVDLPWRLQRHPATHVPGTRVAGWRWRLRTIVAGMGQNSLLLILIPLCLLDWFGFQMPLTFAEGAFLAAACFFLLAALSELTHRA